MKNTRILKTLSAAIAAAVCFNTAIAHAAALDISQSPLMLVDSVSPNLIFTLDDSGSMEWAFAPDGLSDRNYEVNGITICPDNSNGCRNTRRAKSSDFNPIYYNPDNVYIPPKKADGSEYSTSFDSAPWNGFTGDSKINLASSYRPVWHNDWTSSTRYARHPASSGFGSGNSLDSGTHAYYYVYNENLNNCSKVKHDDDCYEKKQPTTAIEKENFANWYSFYRTRGLATISAAHLAFYELPSSIRFTWQRINQSSSPLSGNFGAYNIAHKNTFFTWLKDNSSFSGSTPLRRAMTRAGNFLINTDKAWYNDINDSSSGSFSCRPAYHILMADGMWNGSKPSDPSSYKDDNSSWTTPDGRSYTPKAPFSHDNDDTLADLAMHYWATDLRTDIENDLKPFTKHSNTNASTQYWDPRNNPATWQHMVNFTVGLGLTSSLVQPDLLWEEDKGTFESSGYYNLLAGTDWPSVGTVDGTSIGKVYDLWHTAINSRGEFFSADNPEDLIQSFRDILNRIAERTSTATAAGSNTSVSADDPDDPYNITIINRTFFPEYNSEDWSGDLKRLDVIRLPDGSYTRDPIWSARALLLSEAGRNIKMARSTGDTFSLQNFTYSNMSGNLQDIFDLNPDAAGSVDDGKGEQRVAYLKGARSGEGTTANTFRVRSSVLGDIVNSSPAVVGAPSYIPYLADKIDGDPGTYLAFRETYKSRPELVYVGANDGMLHAFDAATGQEVFAFIPTASLKNMPRLTGQTYKGGAHRFFVDGSPVVRDVYFGGAWHTVLIGTMGAGGRSLFALDITNPGVNGDGIELLWEITPESDGYGNLGYTFPEPEVVRLHSGQWALLQGNGYNSEDDLASLLIIDIQDGSLIRELVVDSGDSEPNGLSSVRGADNNGDGLVDYAYAGDLRGNLWRFDLARNINDDVSDPFNKTVQTSVSQIEFEVSYGGAPLYAASYPIAGVADRGQAITAPPSLVRHPTRRGYIVAFGTGKYFESNDAAPDTTKANSVYGIWDRLTKAEPTSSADLGATGRGNLQAQTINEQKTTSFNQKEGGTTSRLVRYISQTPVAWYTPGTTPDQETNSAYVNKWGWYLDLEVNSTKLGEIMVDRMLVRGDTLLFGTLTPNPDPCADGNEYWTYGINAQTGARTRHPTFDFNSDGAFDLLDTDGGTVPSAYSSNSPFALTRDGSVIDVTGSVRFSASPDLHGRQSWQVMPFEVEE